LAEEAAQKFLSDIKDIVALMKNLTVSELRGRLAAAMELNPTYTEEIMVHADGAYLDQKGYAGRVAREAFSQAMYRGICQSFLHIARRGVIQYAARFTPEAEAQMIAIEIGAGEREPAPPVAPAPPPPSAAELLDAEIQNDWLNLGTAKIRKKCSTDRAYKKRFDELIATDALSSICTSFHDGQERR
jgi:hypothetical protein